jgi:uncharacterized protein
MSRQQYGETLEYTGSSTSLATFMNSVYSWMAAGLGLTAVLAWVVASYIESTRTMPPMGLLLILALAEFGLVIFISRAIDRINSTTATMLFLLFSALNGVSLSFIFLAYQLPSIAGAFVVTAGMFGVTSAYGLITKRDLSGIGGLCLMALIGLIIASIVNMFWASSTLYWIVTYGGVAIFVGLTAYDSQKIKQFGLQAAGNGEALAKYAILGSLILYLDFINMFLFLLRILGKRK